MMKTIFFTLINFFALFATAQLSETFINDAGRNFESIYWHQDGRIYAADYNSGRLYQIFSDGTVETLVTGFARIAGGGFDNEGRFYFSGIVAGTVHRLNDDGTHTLIASGLKQPVGVLPTEDPAIIYVAEYEDNSISKVNINTGAVETWVSLNGISGPDGITYHESGDVLIANFNNNRIHRVDADGNVSIFTTLPSSGFMGYLTRAGDYIYAPSITGKKIYRIDMDGNAELLAGTGSEGCENGPLDATSFNNPNGITNNFAGDSLLITDGNKVRLITGFAPIVDAVSELEINNFIISPNPLNEILNITFELDKQQDIHWEIFDTKGQSLLQGKFDQLFIGKNTIQIPVQRLAQGIHIIKLSNLQGVSTQYQFVKN